MRFILVNDIKNNLLEMAYNRQSIIHELESSIDYVAEHLIQLFLFRNDADNFNHWASEVFRGCFKIPKCRSNNKFLPYKEIIYRLWLGWEDSYDNYIQGYLSLIADKENKSIPEFNDENLYNYIQDYFEWLASNLSSYGSISLDGCKNKIKELLDNYSIT